MFRLILVAAVALLAGCASKMAITFDSRPTGAEILGWGKNYGYAPVTLYFPINKEIKNNGYLVVPEVTAKWVSGATSTLRYGQFKVGSDWTQTFDRPNEAPNAQIDHQFAISLMQARAQKSAADDASLAAMLGILKASQPSSPVYTNCTGGRVSVNCTSY